MQPKYLIWRGIVYETTDYKKRKGATNYCCMIKTSEGDMLIFEEYLFNSREEAENFKAEWLAQPLFT